MYEFILEQVYDYAVGASMLSLIAVLVSAFAYQNSLTRKCKCETK